MRRRLAMLAALLPLAGTTCAQGMDAQALLARVAEVYGQAQDFAARGRASVDIQVFGMRQHVSLRQSAVFRRPNKLRLESTVSGGGGTRTVVSDGRHVYVRQDVTHEYTRQRAPDTVCAIRELQSDAPDDFSTMVDVPTLLDRVDLSERIEEATVERTGTYFGTPVHVLSLTLKGGHKERLWIGREDFLIRKLEFQMNPEGMFGPTEPEDRPAPPPQGEASSAGGEAMEGDDAAQQLGEALLDTMMQAFTKMEMRWTERYRDIRLDAGVSPEAFRFHPRPGERQVDRLSDIPMPEPEMTQMEPPRADLTGQVAPDFTLPNLDGTPVTLSQLRGRPVLLYFWDSLCAPCLMQLPDIQALHEERADEDLQVVGVNVDRALDLAKESTAKAGVTFPVLWQNPEDPESERVDLAYRPEELPRLLVIDAIGIVQADLTGYHEKAAIEEAVEKAGGTSG